jgi:hypothetical protein
MINEEGSGEGSGKIDGSVVHGDCEFKFYLRSFLCFLELS